MQQTCTKEIQDETRVDENVLPLRIVQEKKTELYLVDKKPVKEILSLSGNYLIIKWDTWCLPDFFVQAFRIVVGSNEQLQQQLEYTLLNPDCHSWWISKMQSGREDTLEEQYAIKFCFKLGKSATETYGMLQTAFEASCMNQASVSDWHKRFKEARESMRDDERCGRSKEVNRPELIGQTVGLVLQCWGFKGVQEEIRLEEASTLQIGSVAFQPAQYFSPQLHPRHRVFDHDGHQDSSSPWQ